MSLKQISELYGKNNPSIDDQIVDKNDVLYDVFLEKNDKFEHVELKKDSNKKLERYFAFSKSYRKTER